MAIIISASSSYTLAMARASSLVYLDGFGWHRYHHRQNNVINLFISLLNDLVGIFHSFGAAVKSGISSKTDIVIMGNGAGPKKKEEIKELIASGHFIRIIEEQELKTILDKLRVL